MTQNQEIKLNPVQMMAHWKQDYQVAQSDAGKQDVLKEAFALTDDERYADVARIFLHYPQDLRVESSCWGFDFEQEEGLTRQDAYQLGAAYTDFLFEKGKDALDQKAEAVMSHYLQSMKYSASLTEKVKHQSALISALANVMPFANGMTEKLWDQDEIDLGEKANYFVNVNNLACRILYDQGEIGQHAFANMKLSSFEDGESADVLRKADAIDGMTYRQTIRLLQKDAAEDLVFWQMDGNRSAQEDFKLWQLQENIRNLFRASENGNRNVMNAAPDRHLVQEDDQFVPCSETSFELLEQQVNMLLPVLDTEIGNDPHFTRAMIRAARYVEKVPQ